MILNMPDFIAAVKFCVGKKIGLKVSGAKKRSAEGKPTKHHFFRLILY